MSESTTLVQMIEKIEDFDEVNPTPQRRTLTAFGRHMIALRQRAAEVEKELEYACGKIGFFTCPPDHLSESQACSDIALFQDRPCSACWRSFLRERSRQEAKHDQVTADHSNDAERETGAATAQKD